MKRSFLCRFSVCVVDRFKTGRGWTRLAGTLLGVFAFCTLLCGCVSDRPVAQDAQGVAKNPQAIMFVDIPVYDPAWSLQIENLSDDTINPLWLTQENCTDPEQILYHWSLGDWNFATGQLDFVPGGSAELTAPPALVQISAGIEPKAEDLQTVTIKARPKSAPQYAFELPCKLPAGEYEFVVYDSSGRTKFSKSQDVSAENSTMMIGLTPPSINKAKR
jgi:hypothetical protein